MATPGELLKAYAEALSPRAQEGLCEWAGLTPVNVANTHRALTSLIRGTIQERIEEREARKAREATPAEEVG